MNDLHDLAPGYAVGALSPDEQAAFEAHLVSCADCRRELAEMDEAVVSLALSDSEAPPVALRSRVMHSIEDTPQVASLSRRRRSSPAVWLGAVAAVFVLLLGAVVGLGLRTSPIDRVIDAADAVTVTVAATEAGDAAATVRLIYSPSQGKGVLEARDLDSVGADATYQMWLIGASGPVPAGLFRPDQTGSAAVVIDGVPQPGLVFGVTIEPAGGSAQPTGDVLFAAEV